MPPREDETARSPHRPARARDALAAQLQLEIERRLRAGEHAEALPLLRALLERMPQQPELRHVTAMTALRQGRFAEAASLLEGLPDDGPRPGERSFVLGLARWALDRPEAARQAFERALTAAPTHKPSLRFLSELLARAGDEDALARLHERAAGRGVDPAVLCPPEAAGTSAAARQIAHSYRTGLAAELVRTWCDPEPRRPVRASIIVAVPPRPEPLVRLLQQLDALAEPLLPAEILLATTATPPWLEDAVAPWRERLHVVHAEATGEPVRNAAARHARGEVLVFTRADVEPTPGWLAPLVDTVGPRGEALLAGARVLDPRGRLAEAGLAVFRTGAVHRYGHGHDPRTHEFAFRRAVDAVSGAALAIRRDAFEHAGGFAPGYRSTLYEELDLALRLQQRPPTPHRLPVRYVPEAIVIEHDAPPVTGLRVQVPEAELATLRERHPELAHHEPESIERLLVAAQRSAGPRVLVIAPALPRRDTPRLSARLAQELDNALQAGRATSLLPLDPDDPDRMASVLARRGVRVLPLPRDERPLPERLAQRLEELAPYHFEQILLLAPRLGPTVREATARWEPRPEIRRLVTGDDEPAEVR